MDSTHGSELSQLVQAQIYLYKQASGLITSMSLKCAIDLGIPDIIHNHGKPMPLAELVSALQINPSKTSHLRRLLRLLVHNGLFATSNEEEEEEDAYVLTPPSKLLVTGKEPCLSPLVHWLLLPEWRNSLHSWNKWFHGKEETVFESNYGISFWDFLTKNPDSSTLFNEAMVSDSPLWRLAFRECKTVFESLGTIVDVGGGLGRMSGILAEDFPDLKFIVLDLPHVVGNLTESKNLSYVGGDMFDSIPSADAVLLMRVLHDWDDGHCIKILKNCREAISSKGKEGKVITIDMVIDGKNDDSFTTLQLLSDVMMLSLGNGKERTEKEWKRVFLEAGFKNYKRINLLGFWSLTEIYP